MVFDRLWVTYLVYLSTSPFKQGSELYGRFIARHVTTDCCPRSGNVVENTKPLYVDNKHELVTVNVFHILYIQV